MAGKLGQSGPPGNSNALRHGGYARGAALKGHRWDKRTRTYRTIARKEQELIRALGPQATPQRKALVHEISVLEVVLLPPLDFHLSQARIVNRRGKADGAIELRLRLSTRLLELLQAVGLEKTKRVPTPAWQRRPRHIKTEKKNTEDQGSGKGATGPGESPVGELLRVTPETGE